MQIEAAVASGDGTFAIEAVDLAPPGAGEVLVRMRASGVCHTDWDSLRWGRPLILGHEGAGIVFATGAGVTSVAPGHRVMLNWAIPCGMCFQCHAGRENLCEDRGAVAGAKFRRIDAPQTAPMLGLTHKV